MFDNIIGHSDTIALLSAQLAQRSLPRALLFHGPAWTGKLSTALEVARGLSCLAGSAEWSCPCGSCERHRSLTHPDLLLVGSRYFDVEMAASADAFRRTRAAAARYLFVRAVRKLLRRFDATLWDADSPEGRKALAQVAAVEDLLEALPGEKGAAAAAEKAAEAVVEAAARLLDNFRTANIPVQQIRRLAQWAHIAPAVSHKVAIVEGAEGINESSRNALLKLLEEPPPGVTLILTTTRRSGIIATVLSRLRPFHFPERPPADQAEVLRRIFREEPGEYPLLRDYFLAWKALHPAAVRSLADRFVALVAEAGRSGAGLQKLIEELAQGSPSGDADAGTGRRKSLRQESFQLFCEELLAGLRRKLHEPASAPEQPPGWPGPLLLERWAALVRETAEFARLYNPDASLQIESLFYRMKAAS